MLRRVLNVSSATKMLKKVKLLCIFLPYRRDFDETKYLCFLVKDDELLEKYNDIWEKVSQSIKKELDGKPVNYEKHLKTEIKSDVGKINTNFHNNKIPKESFQCICLTVVMTHSVFRASNNYYPQVFLEEDKYVVKEKKMPEYITDDIELSSDSDREDSDEENCNEENSDEENFKKEN